MKSAVRLVPLRLVRCCRLSAVHDREERPISLQAAALAPQLFTGETGPRGKGFVRRFVRIETERELVLATRRLSSAPRLTLHERALLPARTPNARVALE